MDRFVGHTEMIVAVDEFDEELFVVEKMFTHTMNILHRAVSGFVFSEDGRMLVQKRSASKYHSGGAWANSCCSHPWPGEPPLACIRRRTREELGLSPDFSAMGVYRYTATVSETMHENELVHLFVGISRHAPVPDPAEVEHLAWMTRNELADLAAGTEKLAPWFRHYLTDRIVDCAFSVFEAVAPLSAGFR